MESPKDNVPDGFKAMLEKVVSETPEGIIEDLPTVKGSSRTYYQVASGKGASWFVNIELLVASKAEFVIRFVSIGLMEKPPVHFNFRLASAVTDGNSKKDALYYDQHRIQTPYPTSSNGADFEAYCNAQSVDRILATWIGKQFALEGLEVLATKGQLRDLVKTAYKSPLKATEAKDFSMPADIKHIAKPYEKS